MLGSVFVHSWFWFLGLTTNQTLTKLFVKEESPLGWTQEAYRPPRIKYSICYPIQEGMHPIPGWGGGYPIPGGQYPILGTHPHHDLACGGGYLIPGTRWYHPSYCPILTWPGGYPIPHDKMNSCLYLARAPPPPPIRTWLGYPHPFWTWPGYPPFECGQTNWNYCLPSSFGCGR